MKIYNVKVNDNLHCLFKNKAKSGLVFKYTLNELAEIGMLLVLAEAGDIASRADALAVGSSARAAIVFEYILNGQEW